MHDHYSKDGVGLSITGIHALQLFTLPVGYTKRWVNEFLGDPPPMRARELSRAYDVPHLAWTESRPTVREQGMRLTKSYGLKTYAGPWGTRLVHPVEALVAAAPYLSQWRLTACLDALLSGELQIPEFTPQPAMTKDDMTAAISLLPARNPAVIALKRALVNAAEPVWSPMETLVRRMVVTQDFPEPTLNHPVMIEGNLAYPDLSWPELRLGIEYNGGIHLLDRRTYGTEMNRIRTFQDHGWDLNILVLDDLEDPRLRWNWLQWLAERLNRGPQSASRSTVMPRLPRPSSSDEPWSHEIGPSRS
ncbi:hypothetical protein IEE92_05120 [Kocuria sp. cx-116]|uniref:hypothetical protein n=1 Tax=Kocuria sp. cx-116 TaxID=2771378 RepID=UPI0016821F6E|nr:hypothetical protein [Kocuria sp. cx-116]MBD2761936.1 hypothetical protein [Kocuria sp. cx-116]